MPLSTAYLHPQFALLVYLACFLSAALLLKAGARLQPGGRYAAIDGLRGLLAIGVFICHGAIWYIYTPFGIWINSPSPLYRHLGESSVVMFFMITGFLFWAKILNTQNRRVDWKALYIGRVRRIMPLFLFALTLMLMMTFIASGFVLRVSPAQLIWQISHWASFTLMGLPPINGFRENVPLLGVVWTLRYEWLFYLALPLLAGFTRRSVPVKWTLLSAIFVSLWFSLIFKLEVELLAGFGSGMVAAYWARSSKLCKLGNNVLFAIASVTVLYATGVLFPDTAYTIPAILLLLIPFLAIASGNTFFGLLTWQPIRLLGQMSYSIYLLHLFMLYVVFAWGIKAHAELPITAWSHWGLILILTPGLIGACHLSWRFIESPFTKTKNSDPAIYLVPTYEKSSLPIFNEADR